MPSPKTNTSKVVSPPMHQHLVDHHLKKQRRNQPKQLQEERRDQYFRQQVSVFMNRLQKPGYIEFSREIAECCGIGYEPMTFRL